MNSYDLSSLQRVMHAAAPCPVEIKKQMIDWWGPIIDEYYASSEAIGSTLISAEEWLAHPGSVGKPMAVRDSHPRRGAVTSCRRVTPAKSISRAAIPSNTSTMRRKPPRPATSTAG